MAAEVLAAAAAGYGYALMVTTADTPGWLAKIVMVGWTMSRASGLGGRSHKPTATASSDRPPANSALAHRDGQ